jgi:hypothetical protein
MIMLGIDPTVPFNPLNLAGNDEPVQTANLVKPIDQESINQPTFYEPHVECRPCKRISTWSGRASTWNCMHSTWPSIYHSSPTPSTRMVCSRSIIDAVPANAAVGSLYDFGLPAAKGNTVQRNVNNPGVTISLI